MAKVRIVNDNTVYEVPDGTSIIKLAAMYDTPLLFGCRAASCGTCLLRVVEGMENLSPIAAPEQEVLDSMGAEPNERLGCQAVINGDVTLEIAE